MQEKARREEEAHRLQQEQIKANVPKVQTRQAEQAAKIAERTELLARKAKEMEER